jgi:ribulose-phosphate 3-epimerase
MLLSPSLLSADFGNLERDIKMLNDSEADWIHVDVMDGVFVPNISFGFPVMQVLKKHAKKPLDVHLMIVQPERYVKQFAEAGAHILTVHYEASTHLHRTIQEIKNAGMKAGVSLNPHTPVSLLEDVLPDLDLVLIMSVNPGFAAQKFIPGTYRKIKQLRNLILETGSNALIEIDGGVNTDNTEHLISAGADVLVAGNAVFANSNPSETISQFKQIKPATEV